MDDEDYLLDAPVSVGDGFSFVGGKYSNEEGPAEKWFAQGKLVNACAVEEKSKKAQDPIFGLAMGEASQISDDYLKWFCVEEGDDQRPSVLLVHGFPSQSYSFRKVIPLLSSDFHVVAFDWLGFGFSDKPQVNYGFNYTMEEYINALECLVGSLGLQRTSIVTQGFAAPVVLEFARRNEEKIERLVLLNPPVTDQHTKLPSALSVFTNFLLGEIFAQDPLKAGENPLNECGPYVLDEVDAMVYRRPYLTSGSAGFALQAVSKALKKELKGLISTSRQTLSEPKWSKRTSILWGLKDRWLEFKGVKDFTRSVGLRLVELQEVGHHAQEDFPEEVGAAIRTALKQPLLS